MRLLLFGLSVGALAGSSVAGAARGLPLVPPGNIAPVPDFLSSGPCTTGPSGTTCANPCLGATLAFSPEVRSAACDDYVLSAIDAARTHLGEGPLRLPANWARLSVPEQLFTVLDLERTALGYPPYLGLNAALDRAALAAARRGSDPSPAPGFPGTGRFGGAWGEGFNVLAADYIWMYDDGWGGSSATTSNVACTSATAAGCWGHREELLGADPGYNPGVGLGCRTCEVGAGYARVGAMSSYVVLIERPRGRPPATVFSWAREARSG